MPRYVTRDKLHKLLNENGFPFGKSTLDKLCAPACGQGPPVAALWGAKLRPLYDPEIGLEWAKNRLIATPEQTASIKRAGRTSRQTAA
jgi:hypothetical protein